MSKRPVLYATTSPAESVVSGNVVLYKHTWEDHVEPFHPDVDFFSVKKAMDDPCYICASTTVIGSFVLVNEKDAIAEGAALRVPIKPHEGHNIVTTAYYSSSQSHGTVIWRRGDD